MFSGSELRLTISSGGPAILERTTPALFEISISPLPSHEVQMAISTTDPNRSNGELQTLGRFTGASFQFLGRAASDRNWVTAWRGAAGDLLAVKARFVVGSLAAPVERIYRIPILAPPACDLSRVKETCVEGL